MKEDLRSTENKPSRLTPVDRKTELYPLRRAQEMTRCFLYWIPVNTFPLPTGQKEWLMEFFDRLIALLKIDFGLRMEVFLEYKAVTDLQRVFQKTAFEFSPIMGLSRCPGKPVPLPMSLEDLKPIMEGKKEYNFKEVAPDFSYWFLNKLERRQREEFFGHAVLTMVMLKPDPKTVPPKLPFTETFKKKHSLFQQFDIDALMASTYSLIDAFQAKSKELFGADLKEDPRYPGILYVLPTLCANDFFQRPAEECASWFEFCEVYIRESPVDKGILLALKMDIEEQLIDLLRQMKDKGQKYSES